MVLRVLKLKNKARKDKLVKENHQNFNKLVEYERKWGKDWKTYNEQNIDETERNDKMAKLIQKSTEKEITQWNKGTIREKIDKKS